MNAAENSFYVDLPDQHALLGVVHGNRIVQFRRPAETAALEKLPGKKRQVRCGDGRVVPVVSAKPKGHLPDELVLVGAGGTRPRWVMPVRVDAAKETQAQTQARCAAARASWRSAFTFQPEGESQPGLRPPQIGALHAALAHATLGNEPVTIVLPTGTGKTETMLALLACQRPDRLLVVVPWTLLCDQTARKFETSGLLRGLGLLGSGAQNPVVGVLQHRLATIEAAQDFFARCNVVVATMAAIVACPPSVRAAIAESVSDLYIDEAHHVSARTWADFRTQFVGKKPILQFTATPFRTDGRPVEGKVIYSFPLRKAQQMGYFREIRFRPVYNYGPTESADREIAQRALEQLAEDTTAELRHLVLARTASIPRAEAVFAIYEKLAASVHPILIHSRLSERQRREALVALLTGTSRVAICVDMLGEGFDLPELKIAAVHDPHKSLAITLQFAGRFVRPTPAHIGTATFIANVANVAACCLTRKSIRNHSCPK